MKTAPRAAKAPQRVVGIGASAGGLDALAQLVTQLPRDSGLAFVVLQHLPPTQRGQLTAILAKTSSIPVIDIASGDRVRSDHVHIVPPGVTARLARGALVLKAAPRGTRPHLPIDALLASLAQTLGDAAIGVVLSGTGHDGTEGLRAVHDAGGLTFAQDPATAQFDEMPRSAIAAGVVEAVLSPPQIATELGEIARLVGPRAASRKQPSPLEVVLQLLRATSGIDFTSYKRSTIERRLARRLVKLRLGSLEDYATYLEANPSEGTELYEDLLIHVTEFFRDRPTLDRLVTRVLPEMIHSKAADAPIRVWVPGCATGEEVYSLAMLVLELVGDRTPVQLFGTDLSERAIEVARAGRYPASITAQVGPERLARFFTADGAGFRIKPSVRERCVFVRHDLIADPPFSKLDLVSCRNVLIYLGPALQQRVIPMFHYALDQPGYLILGRAESITGFDHLFARLEPDAPLFARETGRAAVSFQTGKQLTRTVARGTEATRTTLDVQRDVDHILLLRYAPACVLVDENFDVVQFRGRTGPYLEPPAGQPQLSIVKMARDGLGADLRLALQRAQKSGGPIRKENVEVTDGKTARLVNLEVVPLRGAAQARRYFLVMFEDARTLAAKPVRGRKRPSERAETARLRQELTATKEYLQSIVAQHLATSEDLEVANEELQSTNEELHSSNEELQTAKEELQSTNEELETVNEQLQRGNEELRQANDDLVNVLASVDLAIIIVDAQRRIRRFTPHARHLIGMLPSDLGRPISDLQTKVQIPELDATIAAVIDTLEMAEAEIPHVDGTWYRMKISPYRTAGQNVSGAVITFVDITVLRTARDLARTIVDAVTSPVAVLDEHLVVESTNAAFRTLVAADPTGQPMLGIGTWQASSLAASLAHAATDGVAFSGLEVTLANVDGGARALLVAGHRILAPDRQPRVLVGIEDVTAHRLAQQERDAFLDAVSHELRSPVSAILLWAQVLRTLPPDDPRHAEGLDTIEESAHAEAQLVDDLLDLAQLRSHAELHSTIEPIDPAKILADTVDASRGAANAKDITLEASLGAGPQVPGDARRLHRIARNLMSNAIKFTPVGGRIWVSLVNAAGSVELMVRDSGHGIPPSFVERMFEPFAQADRSKTRAQAGLGIGLALVRNLVDAARGTISVDGGGNGRGATFTVRLPVA